MKTKHINEEFVCEYCQKLVAPIVGGGCRSHCPYCLYSKHVDNTPGDRDCECQGLMYPKEIVCHSKKGYMISHVCQKCGITKKNKAVQDSKGVNDCLGVILDIMESVGKKC